MAMQMPRVRFTVRRRNCVARLETIQAVKEGLASMERGEGRPVEAVVDEMDNELRAQAHR
jgi:predicted transcriptional regulator